MFIGERIKKLRLKLGLTQADFGERISLGQSTIGQYEKGQRSVADRIAMLICSEYGVSEEWLRTGEGEMFVQKPDDLLGQLANEYGMSATEISFLKAYLRLSAEKRDVIEELMDNALDARAEHLREEGLAYAAKVEAAFRAGMPKQPESEIGADIS